MEIYERELQKFFKNFMSVMLQAEIGGGECERRERMSGKGGRRSKEDKGGRC